ncbi:MAG: enoyl-CoA hydratase/isomerase family protein [Sedimentitalea sp.]
MSSGFTCETDQKGVVQLELSRAPVNALSAQMLMSLAQRLDDMASDTNVRGVVLSSAFKVFSAGLDLKEAQDFDLEQQHAIVRGLNEGFLALFRFPKPVVVAIDGAAIAGGLFFVLASDYRIATSRAQLGLAEVRVGADFPVGPLEIARDTLDPNALRRLMLTGQPMKADQALTAGILDELCDASDLKERATKAAHTMAKSPQGTFASVKQQIRGSTITRIEAAIAAGANAPEGGWFTSETRAAMQRMVG